MSSDAVLSPEATQGSRCACSSALGTEKPFRAQRRWGPSKKKRAQHGCSAEWTSCNASYSDTGNPKEDFYHKNQHADQRQREKTRVAKNRAYAARGFRGVPKGDNKFDRDEFVVRIARKARVRSGTETHRSRKEDTIVRTLDLPDRPGTPSDSEVELALLRAGIEPNPGPHKKGANGRSRGLGSSAPSPGREASRNARFKLKMFTPREEFRQRFNAIRDHKDYDGLLKMAEELNVPTIDHDGQRMLADDVAALVEFAVEDLPVQQAKLVKAPDEHADSSPDTSQADTVASEILKAGHVGATDQEISEVAHCRTGGLKSYVQDDEVYLGPTNPQVNAPHATRGPLDGVHPSMAEVTAGFRMYGSIVRPLSVEYNTMSMGQESRHSSDRSIPVIEQPIVYGRSEYSLAHWPFQRLIGWLWAAYAVIGSQRPARHCSSWWLVYWPIYLSLCFFEKLGFITDESFMFCPHLINEAVQDYALVTGPDVVRINSRPKMLRLACLPIYDYLKTNWLAGSEIIIAGILSRSLNFRSVPNRPQLPPQQYVDALNIDPVESWALSRRSLQLGIAPVRWIYRSPGAGMWMLDPFIYVLLAGAALVLGISGCYLLVRYLVTRPSRWIAMTLRPSFGALLKDFAEMFRKPISAFMMSLGSLYEIGLKTISSLLESQLLKSGWPSLLTRWNDVMSYVVSIRNTTSSDHLVALASALSPLLSSNLTQSLKKAAGSTLESMSSKLIQDPISPPSRTPSMLALGLLSMFPFLIVLLLSWRLRRRIVSTMRTTLRRLRVRLFQT